MGRGDKGHTRLRNPNLDVPVQERLAVHAKSLLETVDVGELGISEALRALGLTIFDQSNACDVAALEEVGDVLGHDIVGQVAEMRQVGAVLGDRQNGLFTSGVS